MIFASKSDKSLFWFCSLFSVDLVIGTRFSVQFVEFYFGMFGLRK